jgi:hypothetical protein
MVPIMQLNRAKNYSLGLFLIMMFCFNSGHAQSPDSIPKPKKFGLFGSIGLGTQFYSNLEGAARNRPGTWMLSGSPVVRLFGYDAPLSFSLSEQNRSFQQPFNLMGFSPRFKWITFHLGYRSLHFSNYTLSGIPVLGVGVEMNPGNLRIAAQYGRFNRAVSRLDSLGAFGIGNRLSFDRWGYAAKVGFGSRSSYFDLIFLKAWDDSGSVARLLADSVRLNPSENVVIGFNTRLQLSPSLAFEADAAYSAYTGDEMREARRVMLDIFNAKWSKLHPALKAQVDTMTGGAEHNQTGEIVKIFMITQSGAEGISLSNVRQVHLMEPYWNYVRLEQVKGRAIRICSHMDLLPEERTVEVFTYLSVLGDASVDQTIQIHDDKLTSDQIIFRLMNTKKKLADELQDVMQRSAVDCKLNELEHGVLGDYCFSTPFKASDAMDMNFHPKIEEDMK